ncbi:hypothetical protein D3C87_1145130 [compost metagenome]
MGVAIAVGDGGDREQRGVVDSERLIVAGAAGGVLDRVVLHDAEHAGAGVDRHGEGSFAVIGTAGNAADHQRTFLGQQDAIAFRRVQAGVDAGTGDIERVGSAGQTVLAAAAGAGVDHRGAALGVGRGHVAADGGNGGEHGKRAE